MTAAVADPPLKRRSGAAGELHVSSLVVRARPERMAEIVTAIARLPGAEVPAAEGGRIVVTLETVGEQDVLAAIQEIGGWPGVLAATLVFHHVERLPAEESERC
jgi:periplasmic nitrate reductase NapD